MSLSGVAPPTPQTPEPTPRHPNLNTPLPLHHILPLKPVPVPKYPERPILKLDWSF